MPRWMHIATVVLIGVLGLVFLVVGTFIFPFHFVISLIIGITLLVGSGILNRIWQV